MFSFSSLTAERKQLLHVIEVPKVLERKSQVLIDVSFNLYQKLRVEFLQHSAVGYNQQ